MSSNRQGLIFLSITFLTVPWHKEKVSLCIAARMNGPWFYNTMCVLNRMSHWKGRSNNPKKWLAFSSSSCKPLFFQLKFVEINMILGKPLLSKWDSIGKLAIWLNLIIWLPYVFVTFTLNITISNILSI